MSGLLMLAGFGGGLLEEMEMRGCRRQVLKI